MSITTPWLRRGSAVALATSLAFGGALAAAAPASAGTGTWLTGGNSGASVAAPDAVSVGGTIHLEGSGWTDGADDGADDGSWVAIKLGAAGSGGETGPLTTEPAAGRFTFPGQSSGTASIWSGVVADDNGTFSIDVPFPTASNTSPVLADSWEVGETHHLQLLTGSLKPTGDSPRSVYVTLTITDDAVTVSAVNGGRGVAADQVTITVASTGANTFGANEAVSAKVDGVSQTWTAGGTSSATGTLASSRLVFAPGALRAGTHTVTLTGQTSGTTVTRSVTTVPAATWSALKQGTSGTLVLSNLPAGSAVSAVSFSGAQFTGLPVTANGSGSATVPYAIAANAPLGTYPVTVSLTGPAGSYTLTSQKISPNEDPIGGESRFSLTSNGIGIFQGLYQSAFSTAQNALFATAAAGTGAAEDGYLYKLDPTTLEVRASVHPKDVTDPAGNAGQAPYGIGVDDVNGRVWVTNTRTGAVGVYSTTDLALLRQYPAGTISHPRDAIYDPATNRVFVSSASEGTSGNGLVMAFDATTLNKLQDIATGPRTDFNPTSLALDGGILVSPSLSSNKVVRIDTTTYAVSYLTVEGLNVGGRGATGIAFDAAANRLYIASQNSDELVIADATSGATLAEVPTGSGALNVALDRVNSLLYVTNFGGSSVSVLQTDGTKVANLPIARANHVTVDGQGTAYVVDKNTGNKVWRVTAGAPTPVEGGSADVQVLVDIPATGGLTLSLSGNTADLGTAELNPSATAYTAAGTLPTITVADVRSTQAGWDLVGQVGDFVSGAESFPGSSLGWTPKVISTGSGQTVTAAGPKPSGLDVSSPLASSPAGASRGTAAVTADLGLNAPTTVTPGSYSAVLTLTLS